MATVTIKKIIYQHEKVLDFIGKEDGVNHCYWKKQNGDTHHYKRGETVDLPYELKR